MRQQTHDSPQYASVLLVQHQVSVARALSRILTAYYGAVHTATTPEEAESLFSSCGPHLHLVCGQYFGPEQPLGQDLIAAWRKRHTQIQRAVLATGAEMSSDLPPGVDGVYHKPAPLSHLLNLLGVRRHDLFVAHQSSTQPHTHPTEFYMKTKSTQAHQVNTLKERLSQAPKQDKQPGALRTAQGFASA